MCALRHPPKWPAPPAREAWVGWRQRASPDSKCFRGAERIGFQARTAEFSRLVGKTPVFDIVVEDSAETLGAHEGASYMNGHIIFTTKPFKEPTSGAVFQGDIKAVDLQTGEVRMLWRSPNLANGATVGPDGRLYVCFQGQSVHDKGTEMEILAGIFAIDPCDKSGHVRSFLSSEWSEVVSHWSCQPFNSPNDVVVRRADGSIWFTDPSYAYHQGLRPTPVLGEWVWRHMPTPLPSQTDGKKRPHSDGTEETLSCTGSTEVVADGFHRPNGLAFSPDEMILYVTDTGYATGTNLDPSKPRSIYAFDVTEHGQRLSNRRLIYVCDAGIPDGIKVDVHGRIYTGCADGVHVLSPSGNLLGKILVRGCDGGVANLCFGDGPDHESTLFLLAEGAIIGVKLQGTRGALVSKRPKRAAQPK